MPNKKTKKSNKEEKETYSVDFFKKLKPLFFKPSKFLTKLEKEKSYQVVLRDYVLFYMSYVLISLIISIALSQITLYQGLFEFIMQLIYTVIIIFALSALIHMGVLIFRQNKKFIETYKVAGYSLIIATVYSYLILIFSYMIPFDTSLIQQMQTTANPDTVQQLFTQFLSQPGVILAIIINITGIIHSLVFLIMGISKFHQLSKLKSFFAIILPIIAFFILLVLFFLLATAAA